MRAVVLTEPHRVEVTDRWPEPALGDDEVLVAMRAVGICGSDLDVHDGEREVPSWPWVMGHEGGGQIVALGRQVTDRAVGQRVVVEPNYACLGCEWCRAGQTSACGRRSIVGMNVPGLLAERVAVPAPFAWPVPDGFDDAALATSEPLAVARAAVRRAGVGKGDECVVVGAGSQGLLVCQVLIALGAHAAVIEPHAERAALAAELGATWADPDGSARFAHVFDTVGTPASWDASQRLVAWLGTVVMIGMGQQPVGLSTFDLVRRQVTVRGTLIYDHPDDFADTIAAIIGGELRPQATLQPPVGPEDAASAFAQARAAPGKSWIDLSGWHEATSDETAQRTEGRP